MRLKPSIGIGIGAASIAFSLLGFFVIPVFTPGIVLAGLIGVLAGIVALVSGARRVALVTFTFAATPLFGLLLLEYDPPRLASGYLAFIAPGIALVVAAIALMNYSIASSGSR